MSITGKVALITGGAGGLGAAFAKELLKNGLRAVTVSDIEVGKGEELVKELNQEFGSKKAIFVKTDVTKQPEFEESIKKTFNAFKTMDILINNAGLLDDKKWELMIEINVKGLIYGTLLGYKYMGKNNGGKGGIIVNLSSIAGIQTSIPVPLYASTKHAVIGLGRSYGRRFYYERSGVKLITVCPGITETQLMENFRERCLDDEVAVYADRDKNTLPIQKTDSVGKAVVEIINKGENGSFWVAEGGEPPYEIEIPERFEFRRK